MGVCALPGRYPAVSATCPAGAQDGGDTSRQHRSLVQAKLAPVLCRCTRVSVSPAQSETVAGASPTIYESG